MRTRLVGEQALGSALAALSIGLALGVELEPMIERLEHAEPAPRRMSVHEGPDGVTFIRDDFKAPSDSMADVIHFMAHATARRKVAVVGQISDYPGRSRRTYTEFVDAASSVFDEILLVGERAWQLWGEQTSDRRPAGKRRVSVLATVQRAATWLERELRPDDLVLLKASGVADHLEPRVARANDRRLLLGGALRTRARL